MALKPDCEDIAVLPAPPPPWRPAPLSAESLQPSAFSCYVPEALRASPPPPPGHPSSVPLVNRCFAVACGAGGLPLIMAAVFWRRLGTVCVMCTPTARGDTSEPGGRLRRGPDWADRLRRDVSGSLPLPALGVLFAVVTVGGRGCVCGRQAYLRSRDCRRACFAWKVFIYSVVKAGGSSGKAVFGWDV